MPETMPSSPATLSPAPGFYDACRRPGAARRLRLKPLELTGLFPRSPARALGRENRGFANTGATAVQHDHWDRLLGRCAALRSDFSGWLIGPRPGDVVALHRDGKHPCRAT